MKTSIVIYAIAATECLASGLAFTHAPPRHQMSHTEEMLELELASIQLEGEQMMLEADTQRESDVFSRQIEMMGEMDDMILINQVIEDDHNKQPSISVINSGGSPHSQHILDRSLADEMSRLDGERYLAAELRRNDKMFDDIIARPVNDKSQMTRISQRGNLRRQPRLR